MELKIQEFKQAVDGFGFLVNEDLKKFELTLDPRIIDAIQNGMVQKFEYSIELCWKLIKKFLLDKDGIDAKTPKSSIKQFYNSGYLRENEYLTLIEMIDDRNSLSHIYDEDEFNKILKKFPKYHKVFNKVFRIIKKY